ncbi:MAG: phosphate ABC transporter substrate-binding protein [Candidatus Omnitrophica bacterium]|nr:phosphate ABC transporter substrate-binding protein [Candidatus Omnitrophota bacterium]MCM8827274.1 phosphate ABC transporter substrate-binding protein [Candidatus Omnitrophota bacterium]
MRVKYLFFTIIFLLSCSTHNITNSHSGFIQIKGSDTIINAVQRLAEEFMEEYPYIFVAVTGGGSGVGIASLINKTCDIATASREMTLKEIILANNRGIYPKEHIVAYDGIAVVVNHNNPIDKLTIEDLHNIFTGKVDNWQNFSWEIKKIVTLSREVNSGTHMYFKEEIVKLGNKNSKEEFSAQTLLLSSSQAIVEEVVNNIYAIGYLGMGYLSDRIKPVKIGKNNEFYPPQIEYISNGKYPLSRPLYFYTNGEPEGIVKLFVDFVFSSKGQKIFFEAGFVPLKLDVY